MKRSAFIAIQVVILAVLGLFLVGTGHVSAATPVFINEIHYDNTGTDAGEAVEIAGPAGTDLTGWQIVRYNGATGMSYTDPVAVPAGSDTLAGNIPDLGGGYGVIVVDFAVNGIQNGDPDGIALVKNAGTVVVQFLSYGGTFTALDGPAINMTSTDIGVAEPSGTPVGFSLQLRGCGVDYEDFSWASASQATFGNFNTWQVFGDGLSCGLLLTEIVVTPTGGEFIEIYNPNYLSLDLGDVYLTDATYTTGGTYYYNIVTGSNAGGGDNADFHARFPAGAVIAPGEYQTVALTGSLNFLTAYGVDPTYELYEDGSSPDAVPDMREALPGSINKQGGLSNTGEVVILYYWDGWSDLVADLDYVVWGDKEEAVDKTGVSIDGPDGDSATSAYFGDTAILSQDILGTGAHAIVKSWQREVLTEGSEIPAGGNGATGNDETSEDLSNTWCEGPPTPNGPSWCALFCGGAATRIHDIQGGGLSTGVSGEVHIVEGVVVGDFQNTATELGGFFVQEEDGEADADPATSEGIFVRDDGFGVDVGVGDVVRVAGTVHEDNGLTEIYSVTSVVVCGGASVTPAEMTLPFPDADFPERYEGMAVTFPQKLSVTDNFNLGRYGEVLLSFGGRLAEPTAVVPPGAPAIALQAANDLNRILLDDAGDVQNPDPIIYPPPAGLSASNTLRGGDTVEGLIGVLSQNFGAYRIRPTGVVSFSPDNPRPVAVPPVGGTLKAASFSLSNYFTTIDTGAFICGPSLNMACRGADSADEFTRQRDKILAAITAVGPDILALTEIENNPSTAIQDLVDGLNDLAGAGTYAFVDTGTVGTDAIRNGLVYKPSMVTPVGPHAVLDTSVDPKFLDTLNRPSLAQTFEENATGEKLTVAVNHFKSKGSSCDSVGDPDTGDGQLECNLTRTAAATALVNWLGGDPTGSGDPDFLILGDLNCYAMEDPIAAITGDGYSNLIQKFAGAAAYSFDFAGQWGYLQHALASATCTPKVTGAAIWHVNADEPKALDYNEEFKTAGQVTSLYNADAYRSSDHDPLVVGLDLDDGDGVDPAVEDGAPNGGDGNGDGIRDSEQANVASAPGAGGGYVTAEVSGGCLLIGMAAPVSEADIPVQDPLYQYPLGLLRLEIPCDEADVRIIYHDALNPAGLKYRNFGPTPPGYAGPYWYDLPGVTLGEGTVGGNPVLLAQFKLENGNLGDDTDSSDHRIFCLGGPGSYDPSSARAVPAVGAWGLGILGLIMFTAAVWAIRRQAKRD